MTNYQITIGYFAIVNVHVKAENESEAKKIAEEEFRNRKNKMYRGKKIELQNDTYNADGCLDLDATWNNL